MLRDIHVYDFGKLINQHFSLVTQLIGSGARHFNDIDLFIQGGELFCNGIDLIYILFDFKVNVLLQLLQVTIHIVEVIR